jgi:hypothetical protein
MHNFDNVFASFRAEAGLLYVYQPLFTVILEEKKGLGWASSFTACSHQVSPNWRILMLLLPWDPDVKCAS